MISIVLRRSDLKENDQTISCYSLENGKIEAVARGIKKSSAKNSSSLEPFGIVDFKLVVGKGSAYITSVNLLERFQNLSTDLRKNLLGSYALVLSDTTLIPGEKDENFFLTLKQFLVFLNQTAIPNLLLAPAFLLHLLKMLGFTPVFDRCVKCNSMDGSFGIAVAEGGLICEKCQHPKLKEISSPLLKNLQILQKNDFLEIQKVEAPVSILEQSSEILREFAEFHLNKKIIDFKPFLNLIY